MKNTLIMLALLVASFVGGYLLGHHSEDKTDTIQSRIDTVFYERPIARTIGTRKVTINVPRVLFANSSGILTSSDSDTITVNIPNNDDGFGNNDDGFGNNDDGFGNNDDGSGDDSSCSALLNNRDSIPIQFDYESRIYEDSTYRAQVSGLAYGEYHPTLDWVQTYNRTTVQTVTKRHRFAVTAGAGVAWTPSGIQPTVGVQAGVILWGW